MRRSLQGISRTWGFIRRWIWVLLAGLTVTAFVIVLFSPVVRVREMRVQRTDARIDSERIQRALRPLFGRHLLFLRREEVAGLVREALPDVQQVSLVKNYPSELVLRVTLQPVVARLNIALPQGAQPTPPPVPTGTGATAGSGAVVPPPEPTGPPKYDYLTGSGMYVSFPLALSGTQLPVINIVDWAVRPVPYATLLSPSFLKQMRDTETALTQEFGAKVQTRTVYLRAREFHLKIGKLTLWFDVRSPMQDQLARYRTFLKHVGQNGAREYVDLRLIGRIVYR